MDIPVELTRIVISETSPQQVIHLREIGGERSFPIVIGINEALAIDRRLKNVELPRPMTHDLLARVIESLGGRLEKIVIDDLQDHTFIATLHIRQGQEEIEVDARPSDAIALGVAFDTPIFVADHVIEQVMREAVDLSSQRANLQGRRDELAEQIDELRSQLLDESYRADAPAREVRQLKKQLREMQAELEAIVKILSQLP